MFKGLKVGDIITAFSPGIHVVEKLETHTHTWVHGGSTITELVFYRKIADQNGKPMKTKKIKHCHVNFCEKVTCETIQNLIDEKEKEIKSLREFAIVNLVS